MTDQQPSYNELVLFAQRMLNDSSRANKQLEALRWQIENEGCAASHLGETTYECRADEPCGLCRLRAERDRLRAAIAAAPDLLAACEMALLDMRYYATVHGESITAIEAAIAKAKGEKP